MIIFKINISLAFLFKPFYYKGDRTKQKCGITRLENELENLYWQLKDIQKKIQLKSSIYT